MLPISSILYGGLTQKINPSGGMVVGIAVKIEKKSCLLLDVFFNPCDTQACTD
jgi:hypothetical protein